MKKLFPLLLTLAGISSLAYADEPTVLSLQYVSEGKITVALPTVKNTDGSICTSYIKSASPGEDGIIQTSVEQICGAANEGQLKPTNLEALENYESNGLVIQLPTVSVSRGQNIVNK